MVHREGTEQRCAKPKARTRDDATTFLAKKAAPRRGGAIRAAERKTASQRAGPHELLTLLMGVVTGYSPNRLRHRRHRTHIHDITTPTVCQTLSYQQHPSISCMRICMHLTRPRMHRIPNPHRKIISQVP